METKHLSYFKVENFKRFDSLEVNDIGQFNLIVGDNNVGKTSLLEALTFDSDNLTALLSNLHFILSLHNIIAINNEFTFLDFFIQNNETPLTYQFKYTGDSSLMSIEVKQRLRTMLTNEEIDSVATKLKLFDDTKIAEFTFDSKKSFGFFKEAIIFNSDCSFIPIARIYDGDIVHYFSGFSRSTKWLEYFNSTVRQFIPKLTSVELSSAYTNAPILILREMDKDISQPLSQFGDGTVKLIRFLLEVEMCENKRLMIDEIDTGIHYSRMKDFLKMVIQTVKNKNVQLFATTHSKECIQYYTEALQELGYENDGRIIKLADTKAGIKAYTYNFEQFESSLYAYSEIR